MAKAWASICRRCQKRVEGHSNYGNRGTPSSHAARSCCGWVYCLSDVVLTWANFCICLFSWVLKCNSHGSFQSRNIYLHMLLSVIIYANDLPQLISVCQVGQGLHTLLTCIMSTERLLLKQLSPMCRVTWVQCMWCMTHMLLHCYEPIAPLGCDTNMLLNLQLLISRN